MKKLLYFFTLLLPIFGYGQICMPNAVYADLEPALYPLPSGILMDANATGISEDATIGEVYEYTLTAIVPEVYSSPVGPAQVQSMQILMDGLLVEHDGVVSNQLPEGLELVSSNEDGFFLPTEDGLSGCLKIQGTPSENVVAGDYLITFSVQICAKLPISPVPQCFDPFPVPSVNPPFVNLPGEYRLTIISGDDGGDDSSEGGGEEPTDEEAVCAVDSTYLGLDPGLYPLPAGVLESEHATGIAEDAMIGEVYQHTFTIVVPTEYTSSLGLSVVDSLVIFLDSIKVEYGDETSDSLPDGLGFVFSNENGIFYPTEDGLSGCIQIEGIPADSVATGDYLITFSAQLCNKLEALGFDSCTSTFEVPSLSPPFVNFPGEYRLTILGEEEEEEEEMIDCMPDSLYVGLDPGVYPLPAGVLRDDEAIGITDSAKVGESYEYNFTVVVPIEFGTGFRKPQSDSLVLYYDQIEVEYNGEVSSELPEGLAFEFSSPSGVYYPTEDGLSGCFRIVGTPTEAVASGDYFITFAAEFCQTSAFPRDNGCTNVYRFPAPRNRTANLPGEYRLTIEAADPPPPPACMVDSTYLGLDPGLYPLPSDGLDDPAAIGINQDATIGEAYEYLFTVVVPDAYQSTFGPSTADSLIILMDSVKVEYDGIISNQLPEGLSFVLSNENGIFYPSEDGLAGCIKIEGTPTDSVAAGDYLITFSAQLCNKLELLGFDGCTPTFEIPSVNPPFVNFPGEYRLTIHPIPEVEEPICAPDSSYVGMDPGLYPLPSEGIAVDATIGMPYTHTFTILAPEEYNSPFGPITVDSLVIFLDSVQVEYNGIISDELPDGLRFIYSNDTGIFLPTANGIAGCIQIVGTPTEAAATGDYLITFSAQLCNKLAVLGFDGCTGTFQIPSVSPPFVNFPGEYRLTIKDGAKGVENNFQFSNEFETTVLQMSNHPNPFSGNTTFGIQAKVAGNYMFQIIDVFGQCVHSEQLSLQVGENSLLYDASELPTGIYLYNLSNGTHRITGKMMLRN